MKPNELMIGDWVTCPTPFRVTGIYDDDPWVVNDEDGNTQYVPQELIDDFNRKYGE